MANHTQTIATWMETHHMTTESRHFWRDGKCDANIRKYYRRYLRTCEHCLFHSKTRLCWRHAMMAELERIARTGVEVKVEIHTTADLIRRKKRMTKRWFIKRIHNGMLSKPRDPYESDTDSGGENSDDEPEDDGSGDEPEKPPTRKRRVVDLSDDEPSLGLGESKRERKSNEGREEKGEPDEVPRPVASRSSRRQRNSVSYTEIPETDGEENYEL